MNKTAILLLIFQFCDLSSFAQKKEITLEDLWKNRTFESETVNGIRSMKDGIHYTTLAYDGDNSYIIKYEYKTGKVVDTITGIVVDSALRSQANSKWLLPKDENEIILIDDYQFSSDESKILLATETEKIYRHSTREKYYIWHRNEKKLTLLSEGAKQRYATFSPSALKVAFVRENNLFVTDIKATYDGKFNEIIPRHYPRTIKKCGNVSQKK